MKKYLKILGVAVIIGGVIAYFFYYDINKEVRAISKKEEIVTLFQTGVFKDYNKDSEYYRVIIAVCYHKETKLKLETIFNSEEIEYYEKEMRVNKDFIDKISNYETIILKSEKNEVIDNVDENYLDNN